MISNPLSSCRVFLLVYLTELSLIPDASSIQATVDVTFLARFALLEFKKTFAMFLISKKYYSYSVPLKYKKVSF